MDNGIRRDVKGRVLNPGDVVVFTGGENVGKFGFYKCSLEEGELVWIKSALHAVQCADGCVVVLNDEGSDLAMATEASDLQKIAGDEKDQTTRQTREFTPAVENA